MRRPRLTARAVAAAAAALFLSLCSTSTSAQTPAPTAQPGAITGRVTLNDGRPAANVGLALVGADPRPNDRPLARVTTDGDGRFRMPSVAPGRYRLQTMTPTLTSPEMRGGFFDTGKLINVAAGETVEGADFVLTPGGVITGRVTTGDGRPAIGERLNVTYADRRGERGFANAAVNPFEWETDDRGVYRIYGLAPGRYIVSVGQDLEGGTIVVGAAAPRYVRTFHPSTTDSAQARVVELTAGGEAAGVDITLAEAPKSFQATGRVVDEAGKPVADIGVAHSSLRADQRSVGGWGWDGGKSNQAGEFVIKNLFPGRYAAFIVSLGSIETYSEPVTFEVTDGDVSNLTIKVRRGGSVSGTAVVEGTTDRTVLQRLSTLRLFANLTPTKPDLVSPPVFTGDENRIRPDGTFRLAGIAPGRLRIILSGYPRPKGFTLLRIERGGADVTRDGIEVGPAEQISNVRLVIGYGTGVVRGQVTVVNAGQPASLPEGARITVNATRAGATAGGNFFAEVDARGSFVLEGLMSGEYELRITASVRGGQQRFPVVKQNVHMTEGGEASLTVVYDLGKTTEPNQ